MNPANPNTLSRIARRVANTWMGEDPESLEQENPNPRPTTAQKMVAELNYIVDELNKLSYVESAWIDDWRTETYNVENYKDFSTGSLILEKQEEGLFDVTLFVRTDPDVLGTKTKHLKAALDKAVADLSRKWLSYENGFDGTVPYLTRGVAVTRFVSPTQNFKPTPLNRQEKELSEDAQREIVRKNLRKIYENYSYHVDLDFSYFFGIPWMTRRKNMKQLSMFARRLR